MGVKESAEDFLKRSTGSRASAFIGHPSKVMNTREELDRAFVKANEIIEQDPRIISPDWKLYAVHANEVEFWQGDPERKHIRVQYRLDNKKWNKRLLWP